MHSHHFVLLSARLNDARAFVEGIDQVTALALAHAELRVAVSNRFRKLSTEYVLHACYSHFSEYLRRVLRGMFDHDPLMVVGKAAGKLDYHEIIGLGSYTAIADHMVDQVFRRLESVRSTSKLLERLLDHTGVEVADETLSKAMMYLAARHLVVHNAGIIDERFVADYGTQLKVPVRIGGKLQLNKGFARGALDAILRLAEAIDAGLVLRGYLPPAHQVPPLPD